MEWKNQLQEYKIINGKHPEKDWADSPAKIPAHITTFEEIEVRHPVIRRHETRKNEGGWRGGGGRG